MDKGPAANTKLSPYSFLASPLLTLAVCLAQSHGEKEMVPPAPTKTWQKHQLPHDASSLPKAVLPFSTSCTSSSLTNFLCPLRLPWRLL